MGGSMSAFQSLCSRLEENDPTANVVNTDSFPYFDLECAQQLGLALKDNQHVERILLDITNLNCREPEDGILKIACFLRYSSTLKSVLLKSPGLVSTGVYMCPGQRSDVGGAVEYFLSAIAFSSMIEELALADIDLSVPCRAFQRFLTTCNPSLRRLRLSYGRSIEPSEMTVIMNAFAQNTTLRGLELTDVPESVWSACLAGVAMNEHILSLNLNRMSYDYDHAPLSNLIETNTCITSLAIKNSRIPNISAFATSLHRNETIVELILINCGIGVEEAAHVKRLLRGCPHISRFNISGNDLKAEGLAVIADGLYRNQSLSLLDISDNGLEGREASRLLGDILRRNRALDRLDIDRNNWSSPTVIRACADGLARNQAVTNLDMSACSLDNSSVQLLARYGLKRNRHLQVLALNTNHISAEGLPDLIEALKESQSLRKLYMNDNDLSEDGGVLIGQFLSNSRCKLKTLSLNNTNIGNEGIVAIAAALETSKNLESLSFEENNFDQEAMEVLCRSLRPNKTLKQICFSFHDPDWTNMWHDTLEANEGLVSIKAPSFLAKSKTTEAKLEFYSWRNRCRPLVVLDGSSRLDGTWALALAVLSKKSQHTTIYHVLRSIVPTHYNKNFVRRKRSAPASPD